MRCPLAAALLLAAPLLTAQTNCATCHADIAANYARTGMGRSFFRPATGPTVEDYYHALSGSHYSMTLHDGQYFQRRWLLDPAGKQIHIEELKIDYVMGFGNHARSYLHRTER